ncbi:MAG: hypothetical protein GY939_26470 [Actinomycetia bacterium]|nr:hypothetical protein [Actinomycetes bacterium]
MLGTDNGVLIAGANGAVIRRGRLTVVVGNPTEAFTASNPLPGATLEAADRLAAADTWTFEEVAGALHQLVVEYNPLGVAAFIDLDDDPMLFLFDQGEGNELEADGKARDRGHTQHRAEGRSGWTTTIVSGPIIRIGLKGAPPPDGWALLREGAVSGTSALARVSMAETPLARPAAPPIVASEAGSGPVPEPEPMAEPTDAEPEPTDAGPEPEPTDAGSGSGPELDLAATVAFTPDFARGLGDPDTDEDSGSIEAEADSDNLDQAVASDAADSDEVAEAEQAEPKADGDDEGPEPVQSVGAPDLRSKAGPGGDLEALLSPDLAENHDEAAEVNLGAAANATVVIDPSQIGISRFDREHASADASVNDGGPGVPPPPVASADIAPVPGLAPPPPGLAPPFDGPPADAGLPPGLAPPPGPGSLSDGPAPDSEPPPDSPPPPPGLGSFDAPPPPGHEPDAMPPPGLGSFDAPPPPDPAPDQGPTPVSDLAPPPPSLTPPEAGPPPGSAPFDAPPPPGLAPPPDGTPPPGPPPPLGALPPPPGGPGPAGGRLPPPPPPSGWPAPPDPSPQPLSDSPSDQPIGFLFDDINQFQIPITATTIIGSNPSEDPDAAAGIAGMITIEDPSLAPVQVRIRINGSQVTAEDAAGGGSWIAEPGQPSAPLTLVARVLNDGDAIHVGSQNYTYRPNNVGP